MTNQPRGRRPAAHTPIPESVPLDKMLEESDDEPVYRIDEVLPSGDHGTCIAQHKAGKTTLRDNLIRSLVDGDPFLGKFDCPEFNGRVYVIDTEMSRRMSRRWLGDQGIRNPESVEFMPLRGAVSSLDIFDPAVRAEWASLIYEAEAGFAILDCLADVLDALGLSENNEMGRFLSLWKETMIAARVDESMVFHHMGWTAEHGRGSSRLGDYGWGQWKITREDDNMSSPRYFAARGRDVEYPESRLEYNEADRHLKLVGGSRKSDSRDAAMPVVLAFIKKHPGCLSREILREVPLNNNDITPAKKALENEASICIHQDGKAKRHYETAACPDPKFHSNKYHLGEGNRS